MGIIMLKKIYVHNFKTTDVNIENFELKLNQKNALLLGQQKITNGLFQVLSILKAIIQPEKLIDNFIQTRNYIDINKPIEFKLDIEIDNIQYQYNIQVGNELQSSVSKVIKEELVINGKNAYVRDEHGCVFSDNRKVRTVSDNKLLLNIATYPVEFKTVEEFKKLKPIQDWFNTMLLLSPNIDRMLTDVHDYSDVLDTDMANLSSWIFVISKQYPAFYDEFKKTLKTILPEFEYITFNKELSEANIKFNINGFIKEVEFCYLTDKEKMLFVWAAIITLTNSVDIPFVFLQSVDKHLTNVEFVNLFSKIQPKCENQQIWIATEQDDMPTSLQNCEQINQSVENRWNPVLKLK